MRVYFDGLKTDFYGDRVCDGQLVARQLGEIPIAHLRASRHCVMREGATRGQAEAGYLKILAPYEGEAWVVQHDRRALARPGEWVVYDTTQPYVVENPSPVDHLVLMVPRSLLQGTRVPVHDMMARTLGSSGLPRIALEHMRAVSRELPQLAPNQVRLMSGSLSEQIKASLLLVAGVDTGLSQRATLRERICRHVEQRLGDPALTAARIATAMGCSKRSVHAAFAAGGDTLGGYIMRRRLDNCARDLADPRLRHLRIMDVARRWGFVNASHFSRAFRAHTGISPRQYR
jgi:AraC-like DNA-binding protein